MTSNSHAPLRPWPDKHDYAVGYINGMIDWRDGRCEIAYERAMKEAAMQRLRRVDELLHHIKSCSGPGEWPHDEVVATLAAIGPLPDLPPHPGEGE